MPTDPRATCIIGVARRTWHPSDAPDGAPEPLAMWEQVARDAAADTGADASSVLGALESIDIVYSQSWQYDDAVARLAEREVAVHGLGDYRHRTAVNAPPALVVGFATPPAHSFALDVRALVDALAAIYR